MAVTFVTTGHHSARNGAPDQSEGIALFNSLRKTITIGHGAQTLVAPEGYRWTDESKLHTGYKESPEDPPGKYRYQGAFKSVTTSWDGNTDVHFHPAVARLNLSPLSIHSWVDLSPVAPQVGTFGGGAATYRNATHADPSNVSASAVRRETSTDGLEMPGLPAFCYIADCQATLHGFLFIGDWVVPRLALTNQIVAANLITGAKVNLNDFASMGDAIASLTGGTDPRDPPWGQGFSDHPFTTKVWNVLGALDDETLWVEEETASYTIETVSDFAEKNLTKSLAPLGWLNEPEPVTPEFSWDVDPPYTGTGTFYNWYVRDQLSSLGQGKSSIDTTLDDIAYTDEGSGVAFASFGSPRSQAGSTPGFALVYPTSAAPPVRTAEFPPYPESFLLCRTLAEAQGIIGQRNTDLDSVVIQSRFIRWVQKSNVVRHVALKISDLTEKSSWTPDSQEVKAETFEIIRGQSLAVPEDGPWAMLDLEERQNYPGYYRPAVRTPPAGYVGGTEGNLSLKGIGQVCHAIFDQSTPTRTQFSVRSMDAGNAFPPDAPSGLYFPEKVGGGAPTQHHAGGVPESVHLVSIFAPSPSGFPMAQRPLPFCPANCLFSGDRVIYLPRSASQYRHVNHLRDGIAAHNQQASELHKIVCIQFKDGAWSKLWEFDTYKYMGPIVENQNTGLIDERSGDCLSNGILSAAAVYCVLYGSRGERLVQIDAKNGDLLNYLQLTEPGGDTKFSQSKRLVFDNLLISDLRPYGLAPGGKGWHLEFSA